MRRVTVSERRTVRARPYILEKCAFGLFVLAAALTFSAMKLAIGPVPLRFVALLASGLFLLAADPGLVLAGLRRFRRLVFVVVLAAGLATLASVIVGAGFATIARQLVEIHLQAVVGTLVAGVLALRFGVKPVAVALTAAFAISAVIALAQSLGLGAAWDVRAAVGQLTGDPPLTRDFYERRERAMGLAFSPVIFASQCCAILALLLLPLLVPRGEEPLRFNRAVVVICAAAAVLALATGNRSPLLGIAIFLASYLVITRFSLVVLVLPVLAAGLILGQPLLQRVGESGVRAASTNSSSENRGVLREFGIYLAVQRPLGYGLDFDSTEYSEDYVGEVKYTTSPLSIRQWPLHNAYLMFVAKHGLLAILLLALIVPRNRNQLRAWWAFTPYLVHIFYHNDGPLQGENVSFFVIPIAMLLAGPVHEAVEAPKRWRRAFGTSPA